MNTATTVTATPDSSFVDGVAYRGSDKVLLVQIDDTIYGYANIPETVFQEIVAADSVGSAYNQLVRTRYPRLLLPHG